MGERGASRVRKKVGGDTQNAIDDMNERAGEAQQNMRDYKKKDSAKENATAQSKQGDLANDIGLPDENGQRIKKSPVIDAPKDPSMEVTYNGKKTTIGDIKKQDIESGGMKLVPGKDNQMTVVRPDYSTYVQTLNIPGKRTNRQALAGFAETSGLRIVVKNESGEKIDSLPGRSDKKKEIEMIHMKDSEHPDGHYIMVWPGTMTPVPSLDKVGDYKEGCAPQLVYAEARAAGKTREEARALALDPEETRKFLWRVREVAKASPHLKERYYGRKKDKKDDKDEGKDDKKHDKKDDREDGKKDDDDENTDETKTDDKENETDKSEDGNDGLTMREWFEEKVKEKKEEAIEWTLNAAAKPSTWDILAEALLGEEVEEEGEE